MEKAFDPATVEPRWRTRWEELRVFCADASSDRPAFVIALPPPNITAELHLGHAEAFSVQDTLARWHRMLGHETEWCPGVDHAAIATQAVIEKQLAAEGTTKEAIGRDAFNRRVDAWYASTGNRIHEQMKHLGFSCDWERSRFTLDDAYVRAIRVVFKRLFEDGLIYRGPRIVNWCPRNLSAISDEEVRWVEHRDSLVRLRYPVEGGGTITVATVRPETMLGDTGVAVSPGDPRYRHLVGRTVVLPLTGRRVPIVEDAAVQADFGTGALKVTPGHDPLDYDIGQRHGLAIVSVIASDGTMDVPDLPQFHGMDVPTARAAVTAALRAAGAVEGEEEYVHDVGHCDRCDAVLEPLVSEQWWVRMRELAAPAIEVVEQGRVRFHPERPHTDVYLAWMRSIRDWCISRQLWLGHAIPVSTCGNGHVHAWVEHPERCPECGSTALRDDPDVLDTWFSSALWPFAIFGWPEDTEDLRRFYPGHVLGTAREIIFLWVARMIMTGIRFAGDIPFEDVVINSTILATDGARMSKSKGNGVDPMAMIEKHGADAVRAWASAVGTAGQDMRFDEKRMESYGNFANKIWSATRLLVGRLGGDDEVIPVQPEPSSAALRPEDRWLLHNLAGTIEAVDRGLQQFRFHDAMERVYHATWDVYCDWYVELVKSRLDDDPAARWCAVTALDVLLRLLHPFMPFVTEECAQHLGGAAPTLQRREWPSAPAWWAQHAAEAGALDSLIELASALRARRQDARVPPGRRLEMTVAPSAALPVAEVRRLLEAVPKLWVRVVESPGNGAASLPVVAGGLEATLFVGHDPAASGGAGLAAQRDHLRGRVASLRARLDNPAFVERARPEVVAGTRAALAEAEQELASVERLVDGGGA